jgi:hypothetical protein
MVCCLWIKASLVARVHVRTRITASRHTAHTRALLTLTAAEDHCHHKRHQSMHGFLLFLYILG